MVVGFISDLATNGCCSWFVHYWNIFYRYFENYRSSSLRKIFEMNCPVCGNRILVYGHTIKRHLDNDGNVCPSTAVALEIPNSTNVIYRLVCPNCFSTQYRVSIEETICNNCGKAF